MSALSDEIMHALDVVFEGKVERIRMLIREELSRASTSGPASEQDDDDAMWTADRVAKALAKSPEAVRRAHERGTLGLEPIRVGKRSLRWRAGDVRAFARARAPQVGR